MLHIITIHVNCGRNAKSSIRLVFNALWSTPYGLELVPYGVLHMALLWYHMECFTINSWWAIQMLFEVLHMVTFWCHMEYSMWSPFPAVWSASYHCHPCQLWKKWKELHKTCFQCSMEYSIWHQIVTIWSTPPGAFLVSYGVLQDQLHGAAKISLVEFFVFIQQ